MNEITAAADEQSSGIEQVNKAVMQMDEMTQQNAALVEEAASASESMEEQAKAMIELMEFFKIGDHHSREFTANTGNSRGAGSSRPGAGRQQGTPSRPKRAPRAARSQDDDEWEEF